MSGNLMDNLKFDVQGRAHTEFVKAMNLLFDLKNEHKTNRYIVKKGTMYLFNVHNPSDKDKDGLLPFPYKMSKDGLIEFVWGWLNSLEKSERCSESDLDDSDVWQYPAWRVYIEAWGHVMERSDGLVAIEASWAWVGK